MGWFRSAEMSYVSFQFNKDAAHRTVEHLGKLGTVQFTDVRIPRRPRLEALGCPAASWRQRHPAPPPHTPLVAARRLHP
jgi:hypothetical protein